MGHAKVFRSSSSLNFELNLPMFHYPIEILGIRTHQTHTALTSCLYKGYGTDIVVNFPSKELIANQS